MPSRDLQPYPHCGYHRDRSVILRHLPIGPPPGMAVGADVSHYCARFPGHDGDHIVPFSLTEVEKIREASIPGWARGL